MRRTIKTVIKCVSFYLFFFFIFFLGYLLKTVIYEYISNKLNLQIGLNDLNIFLNSIVIDRR